MRNRLATYRKQTEPLIEYYDRAGSGGPRRRRPKRPSKCTRDPRGPRALWQVDRRRVPHVIIRKSNS